MLQKAIGNKAESAYKKKDWKEASKYFENYFQKTYKNNSQEKKDGDNAAKPINPEDENALTKEISLEDALKLCHYAESLFELVKATPKKSLKEVEVQSQIQEDIDSIVDYLYSARQIYEKSPENSKVFPVDSYIDIYEILGQVALYGNQFAEAKKQFEEGYKKSVEKNCGWRIRLSLMFNKAIALENQEKPRLAIEAIEEGIKIIEEEKNKGPSEDQASLLNDFEKDLRNKIEELKDDIKEQEENKDTLKEDEKKKEEEEEEDVEEEEEEEEEANEENVNEANEENANKANEENANKENEENKK